uniref:Acyl-dehydrogenase n=1 Tax=Tetraselmis sp. GSL018 TaxID=582737 RepID=A0A061RG14_9CHLO|mmetsp:Transcript_8037/g.19217  ORF Transcript_8037/g.19217 Transcript_8037/m.19217 type:complete len:511 (+) Transcript_8037:387-1919(+)|eukprot:CAMPEP_0177604604 /NCGR_PEP_ID=MMETSP0419_2-20121207/16215_1 /TAXON_ID=582737 /ORGANISM="Tetraselmis sp., Strain GSL018" /LENGTH=510 /DNA_ID=CAMNT_0019098615 /DNA_START=369 /DNA_END=1901 /DNA_ORIENTATION=-
MTRLLSREEIATHDKDGDMWIIVDGRVYDVSKFAALHPGGESFIRQYAGKDASKVFYELHRQEVLKQYERLVIGTVAGEQEEKLPEPGTISQVPYAEPSFWQGWKSPYYNESHKRLRTAVRRFIDEEVMPDAAAMEEMGKSPTPELYQKMGRAGILAARIGPGEHLRMAGVALPGGIPHEEFDYFHEQIVHEEVSRIGCPGLQDGLGSGMIISLPAVIHFGSRQIASRVVPEVLLGKKRICLAISEPGAGSDVAGIETTAVKSPCGRFYVVNGAKKWITNGTFCDYFVTACKSDRGFHLLLIERGEGLTTKPIKTSYSPAAGTAYVLYEDVKVPVENLLGEEHQGFKCIMHNFNHERWFIVCGINSASRLVVEECMKWANQRRAFKRPLIDQPVIRNKLAHMVSKVEGVQNWLESITYQMNNMSFEQQQQALAGPIALLKLLCTRVSEYVMDEACQVFGGRAISRTGMGQIVERNMRSTKFGAILGGSEEIMADLGMRQALKYFPAKARL